MPPGGQTSKFPVWRLIPLDSTPQNTPIHKFLHFLPVMAAVFTYPFHYNRGKLLPIYNRYKRHLLNFQYRFIDDNSRIQIPIRATRANDGLLFKIPAHRTHKYK